MQTTETWTLFPKLVVLRGHFGISQRNALQGPRAAAPHAAAALAPASARREEGARSWPPRAERSGTSGRRRSGPSWLVGFRAAARARAVQSAGGALAGAADLRAARPDSRPPYWMPQPLLPALPPPSSLCAAGSCGPSGGECSGRRLFRRRARGLRTDNMEAVKTFNSEDCASTPACTDCFSSSMDTRSILYSLNDYKPPISKAKMTQITKAAIKAIKFYKHVVQSVEKFIQKCKPEYKVPGLYVIDSIVRQSRHQFGQEKDVFAPRFSNNIISTFQNLYRCPGDDKSKIVRVLNLWQKNNVFKSEIIQPLLDMAAGIPPPVVTPVLASTTAAMSNTPGTPVTPVTPANVVQGLPDPWVSQITNTDTLAAVAQILQSPQGQQLQQLIQTLQLQQQKPQPSILQALDAGLVVQLQALTAQLTAAAAAANTLNPLEQGVSFNKKLMDRFDFGEDSEHSEEPKKEISASQLSHVSESVNNSIFHQIAEQLQQQNLEHLRQQLLEQQQPQKVYISILWSLELLLPVFCKMLFLKDGGFSSTLLQDQPFQNLYIFCYQNVFWIYACARYTRGGVLVLQLETSHAFLSAQFPNKVMMILLLLMVMMAKTALVQPPLSMTPETVKDVGFGSLVLPGGSVASNLATSALPAGNVFNPPTKQAEPEEKVPHLIDHQIPSAENTRSVIPNDISSGSAILGGQPPNVTSNSGILGVQRPNVSSNSEIIGVRPSNVSSSAGIIGPQPPNILNNSGILGLQPPTVSSSSGLLGVLPPNIPNNSGLIGVQPPNVPNTAGLLGTQPPAGPQNLPPLNLPGQRMPAMPMLDIRPGLIPQTPGPRFPLIQPGIPPQRGIPPPSVLDSALHPPPRGPFPPGDIFSQPERPFLVPGRQSVDNVTNPEKRIPLGNDNIQQEGDRDYRFPPMEARESISRPPPVDVRDVVGRPIDPREGPGRPPLDGRDHFGRPPVDIRENLVRPGIDHLGRRDHFGFNPEKPWGHRDFDEREHRVLPVYGGPKGLHEERGRFRSGNYRFDPRSGPWNRGFGQEVHRDFDDRRRPWERQRDRDDRDFDFCREINGNRLGRDRIQNTWVPPPHARVFDFFEGATSQRKGDNVPQVNGENTERHAQPPPLPVQNDPELYEKLTSSSEINKEKSDTVADIESEPVVESTETEGT
uniref:LOW QUALITY PROTEIN: SR-related and CTD-associated factor 8 n=1 Tax=Panthera onca TaxID=9690 RepID=UPI002953ABDC|nr:LOW QUALITY PROTEIN: SR-related and CTD-associated factor 8 [Panthera onca]